MIAEELGPRRHRDDSFVAFSKVAPLLLTPLRLRSPESVLGRSFQGQQACRGAAVELTTNPAGIEPPSDACDEPTVVGQTSSVIEPLTGDIE